MYCVDMVAYSDNREETTEGGCMRIHAFHQNDIAALDAAVDGLLGLGGGLLLLLAEGGGWPAAELDAWARRQQGPFLGGIFPRVLHGREILHAGGVVAVLPHAFEVHTVLLAPPPELPADLSGPAHLVLPDGLSPHIQPFIEALYDQAGLASYAGGGCGFLSLKQQPCVLSPAGLLADVAAVASLPVDLGVAVRHGWLPVDGALQMVATDTCGNVIHTLDWEPAFHVYRRIVEPRAGVSITPENFFDVAKAYPLGLLRPSGEYIVRDPIRVEGESLVCVGAVRPHSTLTVLHGRRETLLAAADELDAAATEALARPPAGRLVFDCISRALFLGGGFQEELARLAPDDLPTAGALTLGEVVGTPRERIAFCNKTSTLALIP